MTKTIDTPTIHWFRWTKSCDMLVEVTYEGQTGIVMMEADSDGLYPVRMMPERFADAHNNEDDIGEIRDALNALLYRIYMSTGDVMPQEWSEPVDATVGSRNVG